MAQLPIHEEGDSVSNVVQAADPGGDQFTNPGDVALWFRNDAGVVRQVTVVAQQKSNQGFLVDEVITLQGNGQITKSRAFPPRRFNDGTQAFLTYDDATGVFVAAVRQEDYEA